MITIGIVANAAASVALSTSNAGPPVADMLLAAPLTPKPPAELADIPAPDVVVMARPPFVKLAVEPVQFVAVIAFVVLAWRRTFTRYEAIAALRNAIYACELEGVTRLS